MYLLKQNRVIVPDETHESCSGKNIYREDPKFSDRLSGQIVQMRSACSLRIGLIRVTQLPFRLHIVVEPQYKFDFLGYLFEL